MKWTQARQIAALMDVREAERPAAEVTPAAHYAALHASGDLEEAARFLGQALPRYEGIAWAARAISGMTRPPVAGGEAVLAEAMRWVSDPDDKRRRETLARSETAEEGSAERLLAAALFLSGGSIAPPDLAPVQPAPEISGRLAAAAVIVAAHATADAKTALTAALAAGEKLAAGQA